MVCDLKWWFFTQCINSLQNLAPQNVVAATSFEGMKRRLDKFIVDIAMSYDGFSIAVHLWIPVAGDSNGGRTMCLLSWCRVHRGTWWAIVETGSWARWVFVQIQPGFSYIFVRFEEVSEKIRKVFLQSCEFSFSLWAAALTKRRRKMETLLPFFEWLLSENIWRVAI